ncbi:flavoprotein [Halobacillus litoralis]|uniref:Flavoprotein n=1 Tax=Halobacillus litoralis TaxID=45668 RepID=A0A410MCY3_9BACI|nr:flavoprotein [Halobacillus litoralis]QAS52567.1 flavoprotein [Halobacillus litoralis]
MTFEVFFKKFKEKARRQDLDFLKETISKELKAREIRSGEIVDYHYDDSIEGWRQAFDYFADKDMDWIYTDNTIIPLNQNEWLASFWVSIRLDGELLETSNLFFNTFQNQDGKWQLVRTYIEAGVKNPDSAKVCS